jgi:hypothetical protein
MKIKTIHAGSQGCWLVFVLLIAAACNGKKEEIPVVPPLTSPLSQSFIGFGVVNVSYTRVTVQPVEETPEGTASGGYLRRGSVVRVLERRMVLNQEKNESWVLVGGPSEGWLKESLVDIYDSELQARTASESMGR